MYKKYIKRLLDFSSALALFVALIPAFLMITVLVRLRMGSPVFFKQERTGMNGRKLKIIKFRTMTEAKDKDGNYLPDQDRITKIGRVLRSTSLDELPELLNIIKGDMSVIGPRPLPVKYNEYFTEREKNRFKVRSGLIPPEVVHESVEPSWDEQLEYEAEYAEHVSLRRDAQILYAVFKGLFLRYSKNYGDYIRKGLDIERRQVSGDMR